MSEGRPAHSPTGVLSRGDIVRQRLSNVVSAICEYEKLVMPKRPPTWTREGNTLARELFLVSDRLSVLYHGLEGMSSGIYAETWNACRSDIRVLRGSLEELNNEITIDVHVRNVFVDLTYQTCVNRLIVCVEMQLGGCWLSVRANTEGEAEIGSRCFEMARQTAMAYATAMRGVSRGKVAAAFQDKVLREFVKSFNEELLPMRAVADELAERMESQGRSM